MCYQVETTIKEKNLGQRGPGLRTGGGNIGIEVGTTQSSWESVSQGSPHGSSVLHNKYLWRSCTQEKATEPE